MCPTQRSPFPILVPSLAVLLAGCGSGRDGPEAMRAPERAGEVWEVAAAGLRSNAPASVLAFVEGVHVLLLDGRDTYTGMTHLKAESRPEGARAIQLSNGLEAEIVPAGDSLELRFASGERIPLRKRTVLKGAER